MLGKVDNDLYSILVFLVIILVFLVIITYSITCPPPLNPKPQPILIVLNAPLGRVSGRGGAKQRVFRVFFAESLASSKV